MVGLFCCFLCSAFSRSFNDSPLPAFLVLPFLIIQPLRALPFAPKLSVRFGLTPPLLKKDGFGEGGGEGTFRLGERFPTDWEEEEGAPPTKKEAEE